MARGARRASMTTPRRRRSGDGHVALVGVGVLLGPGVAAEQTDHDAGCPGRDELGGPVGGETL
jgi:hypothetical protein